MKSSLKNGAKTYGNLEEKKWDDFWTIFEMSTWSGDDNSQLSWYQLTVLSVEVGKLLNNPLWIFIGRNSHCFSDFLSFFLTVLYGMFLNLDQFLFLDLLTCLHSTNHELLYTVQSPVYRISSLVVQSRHGLGHHSRIRNTLPSPPENATGRGVKPVANHRQLKKTWAKIRPFGCVHRKKIGVPIWFESEVFQESHFQMV